MTQIDFTAIQNPLSGIGWRCCITDEFSCSPVKKAFTHEVRLVFQGQLLSAVLVLLFKGAVSKTSFPEDG